MALTEPFAVDLYRRFLAGEPVTAISQELGIPADRVRIRILAALRYVHTRRVKRRMLHRHGLRVY